MVPPAATAAAMDVEMDETVKPSLNAAVAAAAHWIDLQQDSTRFTGIMLRPEPYAPC